MIKLPKLPTLQPRERLLAVGCGVAVLVVLLDRLVLSPWSAHIAKVRQEIAQMEEALITHERLVARKERVFHELERHRRYIRQAIADDLQMAALLKEVEDMAAQSQLVLNEIKPLRTEADEVIKRYLLEVRFACTPQQWAEFVFRIETSPSLYEVVRANLSVQDDQPELLEGYLRVMTTVAVREDPDGAAQAG